MFEGYSQEYIYLETYNVDSLLLVLPDQHAEDRINTLNSLSISLCYEEFAKSEQYAIEAMNLAKELDYQEGIADSYRNFGHIAFYQGDFPDALNNYLESLHLYEEQDKRHTVARVYLDIAKTQLSAGNHEKVFEYGYKALDKFREPLEGGASVGNVRDTTALIAGTALAYLNLGMYDEALDYYLMVLEVGQKNNFGNTEMMLTTLMAGSCYYRIGEKDNAIVYLDKALAYPDDNPSIQALKYHAKTIQADMYYSEGKIDSVIFIYQMAFEWYSENGFLYWAMYYANSIASIHSKNNAFAVAEKYFQQSEKIFEEMMKRNSWYRYDSLKYVVSHGIELYFPMPRTQMKEKMWKLGRRMFYGLYKSNEVNNRTENALKYFIEYHNATDTLNKLKRSRETKEFQTKSESERKDQQIETLSLENELKESLLQQKNYFLFGSVSLFIIILMFGYILFRQKRFKTNQQMIILQQKLLRSQLNPHFIFNSLSSIQGFVMEKHPRTASRYLSRFATLIRNILDSSAEELVPLEKEISTIENYLELQKVRYEGKFEYVIEVDEMLETETISIPPMLAQPFIENSIEHGIKFKDGKGNIKVSFGLNGNFIQFEIIDDGIGREKAIMILRKQNKDHRSMSTDVIRERLAMLNKKLKKKITLEIIDLKNEAGIAIGTKVVFEIPLSISCISQ